jgi:hypothetical protein
MRTHGRRRFSRRGLAVTASLLVHALVALLLVSRPRREVLPFPAPSEVPITFEVGEPSGVPAPSPRAEAAPDARPHRRGPRAAPVPAPRAEAEPSAGEAAPPPETDGVASSPGAPVGGGPAIDLSLGALGASTTARIAGPAPEATLEAKPHRWPSLDELRVKVERQEDAAANVAKGRVDPVLYDYLRDARVRFHDEAKKVAEEIPLGAGATVRSWGRGYAAKIEEWQRGQAGPPPGADGDRPPADVLGGYGHATSAARVGAEVRTVELCMDVAASRTSPPVVRRGSGVPALDRIALDAFARAAAVRPAPADLRAGLACYELRVSAHRMPPVPMLSCSFDIGGEGVACAWPFKRITKVTGRLLSVDYEHDAPPPDKPSLLRRPR